MSAAAHKLKVVQLVHSGEARFKRLYNGLFGVVYKYHDMRQLKRGVAAYLNARGNARSDGGLGCPHLRRAALTVIVLFKVDSADKSHAHAPVRLCALCEDKAVLMLGEKPLVKVAQHFRVYRGNALPASAAFKPHLGQDKAKRGGRRAHCFLNALPVFGLACVLVARYNAPFCHALGCKLWQEYIGGRKSCHNFMFLSYSKPKTAVLHIL